MSNTIQNIAYLSPITGFNRKWCGPRKLTDIISDTLINKTLFDNYDFFFKEPSEYFVSMRVYPFHVPKYFNYGLVTTRVKFGDTVLTFDDGTGTKNLNCPELPYGVYYKHFGTIQINRIFNNYLDFYPYTKLELYVPYCGIVTLDTNVVMGKEIKLFYSIDWDTGACTAYIIKHEPTQGEYEGDLIMTTNGQIGFDIPIGSSNMNEVAKKMLGVGATIVGGTIISLASGNPIYGLAAAVASGAGTFKAAQEHVTKGCGVNGSNALVNPNAAYLIRTTPKPVCTQESYAHYKGLPLNQNKKLSTLSGYTKVKNIHLENIDNATSTELEEIETLLKNGVII